MPRTIAVQGQGSVEAEPDIAEVVTGVVTRESNARAAIGRNNAAMEELLSALKAAGIPPKDIQTSGFSLSPQYDRPQRDKPREITGYQASNQVTVTVRDVRQVGAVIDKVVAAGANDIHGIRFSISDPQALKEEARRKAMADAKRSAETLASLAGAALGRVLRIQEGGGQMPQPRMMMEARAATPIAPGTEEVAVVVQVQYELR